VDSNLNEDEEST